MHVHADNASGNQGSNCPRHAAVVTFCGEVALNFLTETRKGQKQEARPSPSFSSTAVFTCGTQPGNPVSPTRVGCLRQSTDIGVSPRSAASAILALNSGENLRGFDMRMPPGHQPIPTLHRAQFSGRITKETRVPIPATKTHAKRVDYEYERAGTASLFLFCEPLLGWRFVSVRERRTKIDWALEMEELLRTRYALAEKVILVCDNLNTHTKGRFTRRSSRRRRGQSCGVWSSGTRPSTGVG